MITGTISRCMALGMYARQKLHGLPARAARTTEMRASIKMFFKQPRILRKVARLRALAQLDGSLTIAESGDALNMRFPFALSAKIARHIITNKIKGTEKFALVLQLEPLHTCNLTCTGCGRIREYSTSSRT